MYDTWGQIYIPVSVMISHMILKRSWYNYTDEYLLIVGRA